VPDAIIPAEWWPDVDQVAALLRVRTLEGGRSGEYVGTFNANTSPTATQVQAILALAIDELSGRTDGRTPCTPALEKRAASFIVYRAAQLVEMSYRPEASQDGTTLAAQLGAIADSRLVAIVGDITDRCPLPDAENEHPPTRPFGPSRRGWCGPTIGRRTVW
jgi:hypothetical protein